MAPAPILIEACLDSVPSALAAEAGGARRIELCDNLVEGGTTPSAGAIELCKERLSIPVFVMIRPRGGEFLYSDVEFELMRRDVAHAKRLGADGVVFGLLTPDGRVDVPRTRALLEAARPMAVTFHRAFDVARDADEALETLIEVGVDRVLTSGQASTAPEGAELIARLVARAAGRIGILPGCGLDEANLRGFVERTGVREVHVRGTCQVRSAMLFKNPRVAFRSPSEPDDFLVEQTDPARIRAMADLLR